MRLWKVERAQKVINFFSFRTSEAPKNMLIRVFCEGTFFTFINNYLVNVYRPCQHIESKINLLKKIDCLKINLVIKIKLRCSTWKDKTCFPQFEENMEMISKNIPSSRNLKWQIRSRNIKREKTCEIIVGKRQLNVILGQGRYHFGIQFVVKRKKAWNAKNLNSSGKIFLWNCLYSDLIANSNLLNLLKDFSLFFNDCVSCERTAVESLSWRSRDLGSLCGFIIWMIQERHQGSWLKKMIIVMMLYQP